MLRIEAAAGLFSTTLLHTADVNYWEQLTMKLRCLIISIFGLVMFMSSAMAGQWDFREKSISAGLGYESKMPNEEKYEGTKLILEGSYFLSSEQQEVSEKRRCCVQPSVPTQFRGLFTGELRFSLDGADLEYAQLGITPWAKLWESGAEADKDRSAKNDYLEVGATRYIKDKPLEVDSYLEIALGRVGRMLEYHRSSESPHRFKIGVQASTGWAWARSEDKAYSQVSNPFAGIYMDLAYEHEKWGGVYAQGRFVNGFSFSNPSRGHPTAREALVRSGYYKRFRNCLKFDLYWAKRSFHVDEGGLPGLYTWVRTYAAELTCRIA